jgi:hypothetical protein
VLRLLTRRRCLTCGEDLPPSREYPMRVCATCILAPTRAARLTPLAQAAARWHSAPQDDEVQGEPERDGGPGDCA